MQRSAGVLNRPKAPQVVTSRGFDLVTAARPKAQASNKGVRATAVRRSVNPPGLHPVLNPFLANRLQEFEGEPPVTHEMVESSLKYSVQEMWHLYTEQRKKARGLEAELVAKDSRIHRLDAKVKSQQSALARDAQTIADLTSTVEAHVKALDTVNRELESTKKELERVRESFSPGAQRRFSLFGIQF